MFLAMVYEDLGTKELRVKELLINGPVRWKSRSILGVVLIKRREAGYLER